MDFLHHHPYDVCREHVISRQSLNSRLMTKYFARVDLSVFGSHDLVQVNSLSEEDYS